MNQVNQFHGLRNVGVQSDIIKTSKDIIIPASSFSKNGKFVLNNEHKSFLDWVIMMQLLFPNEEIGSPERVSRFQIFHLLKCVISSQLKARL